MGGREEPATNKEDSVNRNEDRERKNAESTQKNPHKRVTRRHGGRGTSKCREEKAGKAFARGNPPRATLIRKSSSFIFHSREYSGMGKKRWKVSKKGIQARYEKGRAVETYRERKNRRCQTSFKSSCYKGERKRTKKEKKMERGRRVTRRKRDLHSRMQGTGAPSTCYCRGEKVGIPRGLAGRTGN